MAGGELRRLCGEGFGRAERLKEAEESAGEAFGVKEEESRGSRRGEGLALASGIN